MKSRYNKTAAALIALGIAAFPLLGASAQYNNSAGNPLRSVLPGVGTTVGVDLQKELLSGTVLPVANGGSGAGSYTAHGVIMGQGTSGFSASSAGTSGKAFISGGASADGAYGTLGISGGGTGATTFTAHGILLGEGTSPVTPAAAMTNGQVLIGSTGADPAPGSITSTGNTVTISGGAGTINIDTVANVQQATYNLTKANILAMNGAPVTVLAGVSSKTIVPIAITMQYTEAGAAYGGGGNISFTYHGSSTCTGTVASTALTAASGSTYSQFMPVSNSVTAQALGIDITNATGAFTDGGTSTGTATITIKYFTY
jgi:hypothetical protein